MSASACLVAPLGTSAQTKPVEFIKAIPDAPAFTFLEASPTKIERPGNLRDLGFAIVNGIGDDGKPKQGFAVDASVWNLIPGYNIPLAAYQTNRFKYALANLQASLATLRASGDSADLAAAFGLKAVIVDQGDPMLSNSVSKALAKGLVNCRPADPGAGQGGACVDSVVADIIGNYTASHWNATQVAVAAAWGTVFDESEFNKSDYSGMNAWLVGAVPVGTKLQLLGQGTYKQRTLADSTTGYRALNAGVRLIGGSATFSAFAEVAREWRTPTGHPEGRLVPDKDVGGWSAGAEFRAAPNIWISTGFGTQLQALRNTDKTVVFANIKWGVSSESRIGKLR
jgi:hypothetical protein